MHQQDTTRPEVRQSEQTVRFRRSTLPVLTVSGVIPPRTPRFEWNSWRKRPDRRPGR